MTSRRRSTSVPASRSPRRRCWERSLRRESRGCHNRSDYPELDDRWLVNLVISLDDSGELTASERPVPPVPAGLVSWIEDAEHPDMEGRLLE